MKVRNLLRSLSCLMGELSEEVDDANENNTRMYGGRNKENDPPSSERGGGRDKAAGKTYDPKVVLSGSMKDRELFLLRKKVAELEDKVQELEATASGKEKALKSSDTSDASDDEDKNAAAPVRVYSKKEMSDLDASVRSFRNISEGGLVRNPSRGNRSRKGSWPFLKKAHSLGGNSQELINQYTKISRLGKVMNACKQLPWKESMYTPLAKKLIHSPIPHLTVTEVSEVLKDAGQCLLRIVKECPPNVEEAFSKWPPLDYELVWANQSCLDAWGQKDVEGMARFYDLMFEQSQILQLYEGTFNKSIFQTQDLKPKRHMYTYYGSKPGVKEEATMRFNQYSCVLVEDKKRVYFGIFFETSKKEKYPGEVMHTVLRAHACWKGCAAALVLFTPDGVILQQNTLADSLFGFDSVDTNVFSDFKQDGTPVDRIKALFVGNEDLYGEMWDAVMVKNRRWWSRLQLGLSHLQPATKRREDKDVSAWVYGDDTYAWYYVLFQRINDPADGNVVLSCELKDISDFVHHEEKLRAAKVHEHELLESIIPGHIIEHLIVQKKDKDEAKLERSNTFMSISNSDSTDNYLNVSALRMIDDQRVSEMAEHHKQVTVIFADIAGFTRISSQSSPGDVMIMLNRLFSIFDDISEYHNIYKVETIGDAYMSVAGLNLKSDTEKGLRECGESKHHASRMIAFCKDILDGATSVLTPMNSPVEIRIGVHTGDVMTGVVGYKMPRFCLFGDTVNVASRMESTGKPGHIHASDATRDLAPNEDWEPSGGVHAKGIGNIPSWFLTSARNLSGSSESSHLNQQSWRN